MLGMRSLGLFMILCLFLSARAGESAESETLIAVMNTPLRALDPIATSSYVTRDHGYMIYDVLIAQDENFKPQPQMADWVVSADGLLYTFSLRDGLLFHDGAPVTSADVIASLHRWGKRDRAGQLLFEQTLSLEAQNQKQINWRLRKPFPALLEILSKPSSLPAFIMPRRVADTPAEQQISEFTGSGPFKFVAAEFRAGSTATYEKFEQYIPRAEPASWMAGAKVARIKRVKWISMPDAQTAANALAMGEIDLIEGVPIDLLPSLDRYRSIVTEMRSTMGYQVFGRMNFRYPPFDNVDARRAAMLAIGQIHVLTAMVGKSDYFKLCTAVFGCGTPFATDAQSQPQAARPDLEKAKALLAKSGYKGVKIVILRPADVPLLAVPPIVAAQALRQVGFAVELQSMDWQTLLTRRENRSSAADGGWSMFFSVFSIPEVSSPLSNSMLDGRGDRAWFGWPDDSRLEMLRLEFLNAETEDEKKAAAYQIQNHAIEEAIYIPLGEYLQVQARNRNVIGILPTPNLVFWGVSKSE